MSHEVAQDTLPPEATAASWIASGREEVGKPRAFQSRLQFKGVPGHVRPPDLSVVWEEFTFSPETSGAFSSSASTMKCQVEGKHNPSPSSWAAIQPRVTEISLQSHQGWS